MTFKQPVGAVSERDRAFVRAVWSFGAAGPGALGALVSPGTTYKVVIRRLARLTAAGYLARRRLAQRPGGVAWLYQTGPRAGRLDPAYPSGWKPSLAQLAHTVAVADIVARLVTRTWPDGFTITGWAGEAELRGWTGPADPRPDARLDWNHDGTTGAWLIELDRGTEARGAWRRKLVRYLAAQHDPTATVLVITTARSRAQNIGAIAAEVGVRLLAASNIGIDGDGDLEVFDARLRTWRPLLAHTGLVTPCR